MFKEAVTRKIDELILRSIQLGQNSALRKEGKPYFDNFIDDYKRGREVLFCRYINMLDGYDYESDIHGLENLEPIKNQPILIVANHPYGGPLRGHGQRFVLNHYVNQVTQKEIRWLHGLDKTSLEQFIRMRFVKQSGLIPVRDDDPEASRALIIQAFRNKDTMGINPEGDGNKTLLRAVPGAARMIILAAIKNYNIVCVATGFENSTFFMAVDPPLNNTKIREARRISTDDKEKLQQMLSDYAMARIAKHLPAKKQGYYQNYQKFIAAFEESTS